MFHKNIELTITNCSEVQDSVPKVIFSNSIYELGEMSFGILELGEVSFGIEFELDELGKYVPWNLSKITAR